MTLSETILQKLTDWRPSVGRQTISMVDEAAGWAVAVTADRCDPVGCLVWEMMVRHVGAAGSTGPDVSTAWQDALPAKPQGCWNRSRSWRLMSRATRHCSAARNRRSAATNCFTMRCFSPALDRPPCGVTELPAWV